MRDRRCKGVLPKAYNPPMQDSVSPTPRALLFGATGPIGRRVLQRLLGSGWRVTALSRGAQPSRDGVEWRCGGLPGAAGAGAGFEAILSCGPLDLFSRWYADT